MELLLALVGGIIIGLGAACLMYFNQRKAGISGILSGIVLPQPGETLWRAAFIAGLLAAGGALFLIQPGLFRIELDRSVGAMVVAGLLVGVGTRLAGGCTSGHGVCGISGGSRRSLAATICFMTTGAAAVYVTNHLLGGVL